MGKMVLYDFRLVTGMKLSASLQIDAVSLQTDSSQHGSSANDLSKSVFLACICHRHLFDVVHVLDQVTACCEYNHSSSNVSYSAKMSCRHHLAIAAMSMCRPLALRTLTPMAT